jgi:two-component system cell cycle sensor histidine kinase/response regulator CckA
MRIAVVEDDPGARAAIAAMLSEQHEARAFCSAEEVVEAIDAGADFDAIVTDAVLPGMSGPDLIRALAAHGLEPTAVIVTGYALSELDLHDLDVEVLTKPFLIDDLFAAVQRRAIERTAMAWSGSSASIARDVQSPSPW